VRRPALALAVLLGVLLAATGTGPAGALTETLPPPTGVTLTTSGSDAIISWDPYPFPADSRERQILIERNGVAIGRALDPANSFVDPGAPLGAAYRIRARALRGGPDKGSRTILISDWVEAGTLPSFYVGGAAATLNPTPEVAPPDGQVFLGGFGLGATRRSEGVLGVGAQAKVFVVDNGEEAVALVQHDNQGIFAAYDVLQGPVGTLDMAAEVEAQRPALAADHIVIASTHSHAGQDLIGVWGGVPNEYLEYVKDQTVSAIVAAYDAREFANLSVGSIGGIVSGDASTILNSQFDDSSCTPSPTPDDPGHTTLPCSDPVDFPNWDLVDESVRVLHARRPDGSTVATLVNFAAHSTVMGSGNHLISADWPGPTGEKIENALGGVAVVMPAANGRTQPDRSGGTDPEKLDAYAGIISATAIHATTEEVPLEGTDVTAKKRLIFEIANNAGLLGLLLAGEAGCLTPIPEACVPIMRAKTPPWLTGPLIGTVVSAVRIGNVLLSGTPGEPYPQIAFGIQEAVDAGPVGPGDITHHFIFSLSDDQLGYLIAPTEGVPFAAMKTAINGNDNFLFNVGALLGDHVMCTAIALALDVGFSGDPLHDDRCVIWQNEPDLPPAPGASSAPATQQGGLV
jgi:hypothetical protein